MHRRLSRISVAGRVLAAGMALAIITGSSPALSDPADIFTIGAPLVDSPAPQATPTAAGDASVSANGSLEYSYPIRVPPGRNGMQPHLALTYSSQAPIYGGLAAGWSLDIPMIGMDMESSQLFLAGSHVAGQQFYRTTLGGGGQLVQVSDPQPSGVDATYRGAHDGSFTRYQRMSAGSPFAWRAYTTDGIVHTFGDTDHITGCSNIGALYAPLTKSSDAFGNLVEYRYGTSADGGCRISSITWGQNTAAGVPSFATVSFGYNSAPPVCGGLSVGFQESFRTGFGIVTGASELDTITATAGNSSTSPPTTDHTRVITLAYSGETASCTANHSAYRSLVSIQESASGIGLSAS